MIEMVFPAMYIINRFIGICLRGPSATSQHRCNQTSYSHAPHTLLCTISLDTSLSLTDECPDTLQAAQL
uniref:Uncharacterized protein n=1 Tax=Erpetoichthys calabaricus TaxID=27687 RepID=A0A8C4RQJ7_ERPCA